MKYRIYNKDTGEMVGAEEYLHEECPYSIEMLPTGLLSVARLDICGGWSQCSRGDIVEMPCSGLPDKTGRMIYDGDILKAEKYYKGFFLVEWRSDLAAFKMRKLCSPKEYNKSTPLNMVSGRFMEIVGNCYENQNHPALQWIGRLAEYGPRSRHQVFLNESTAREEDQAETQRGWR
jgi:hypothetical protein